MKSQTNRKADVRTTNHSQKAAKAGLNVKRHVKAGAMTQHHN